MEFAVVRGRLLHKRTIYVCQQIVLLPFAFIVAVVFSQSLSSMSKEYNLLLHVLITLSSQWQRTNFNPFQSLFVIFKCAIQCFVYSTGFNFLWFMLCIKVGCGSVLIDLASSVCLYPSRQTEALKADMTGMFTPQIWACFVLIHNPCIQSMNCRQYCF